MTKLKLNQLGTRQIFLLNFGDADADGSDDDGHDDADGDDDDTYILVIRTTTEGYFTQLCAMFQQ